MYGHFNAGFPRQLREGLALSCPCLLLASSRRHCCTTAGRFWGFWLGRYYFSCVPYLSQSPSCIALFCIEELDKPHTRRKSTSSCFASPSENKQAHDPSLSWQPRKQNRRHIYLCPPSQNRMEIRRLKEKISLEATTHTHYFHPWNSDVSPWVRPQNHWTVNLITESAFCVHDICTFLQSTAV